MIRSDRLRNEYESIEHDSSDAMCLVKSRKLARLERSLGKTEETKSCLEDKKMSYCLYHQISTRGSFQEALLGAPTDPAHGLNFTAEFTVTCTRQGKRKVTSYPLKLCPISHGHHCKNGICGLESRRMPPWIGHVLDCNMTLFPCCRLQVIVRHLEDGMIARVFLLSLDLTDMPYRSKTIVRQTGIGHVLDSASYQINTDTVHLLQFMIRRDSVGRIGIDGRVRMCLPLSKSASLLHKGRMAFPTGVEEYLEMQVSMPDNPKYFLEVEASSMESYEQQHLPLGDGCLR